MGPIAIGVTGTQKGMRADQAQALRLRLRELRDEGAVWLHHGDCIGVDDEACMIARTAGFRLHSHPPDRDDRRAFVRSDLEEAPLPYLERNRAIVASVQLLLAVPGQSEEILRSGTWSTVRYARGLEVPYELFV